MRNYIILIVIVIMAVTSIGYLYSNYQSNNGSIKLNNKEYIDLYNKEVTGTKLATLINKTLDKNEKNNVPKEEEYYLNNGTNSIIIEIKFADSDNIFRIEKIAKNGIEKFIDFYTNFKFKCTKIEYHEKTKLVKYLYFEQV